MALMDMADIEPLFSALRELLKPGGRFVFTVCHPAFNSTLASASWRRARRTAAMRPSAG